MNDPTFLRHEVLTCLCCDQVFDAEQDGDYLEKVRAHDEGPCCKGRRYQFSLELNASEKAKMRDSCCLGGRSG